MVRRQNKQPITGEAVTGQLVYLYYSRDLENILGDIRCSVMLKY
jgi:hypothetical protein